jgi:ribosomal protein S18 acetylase RimI-like enzyme
MVTIRPADEAQTAAWLTEYEIRVTRWFDAYAYGRAAAGRVGIWERRPERLLARLEEDGDGIGHIMAVRHPDGSAGTFPDAVVIYDVWVRPEFRRQGYGRVLVDHVREWAEAAGAPVLAVSVWGNDPGVAGLFARFPLRSQRMVKPVTDEPLPADAGWSFRPLQAGQEYEEWQHREIVGFAADLANSGSISPDRALGVAAAEYAELLRQQLETPGYSFWVLEAEGEPVAEIWLHHSDGLSFVYGVEVRPEARGKGYGRAAMLVGEEAARAAGDGYIGLNVFGHNDVAIRLYESLGYDVVDQIRSIDLA